MPATLTQITGHGELDFCTAEAPCGVSVCAQCEGSVATFGPYASITVTGDPMASAQPWGIDSAGRVYVYSAGHNGYVYADATTGQRRTRMAAIGGLDSVPGADNDPDDNPYPADSAEFAAWNDALAAYRRCPGSCAYIQAPHTEICYVGTCPGHATPTTLTGVTDES